jgi:hypothetical protein
MSKRLAALLAAAASILFAAVALAASAFDVQANQPQVAGDPASNATARFPTNKQNEPSIAVNPMNPSLRVPETRFGVSERVWAGSLGDDLMLLLAV